MKRLITFLFCAVFFLTGCNTKKSAIDLFNDEASGVVVILNEYYYEIQLPNGGRAYFTDLNSDGDLAGFSVDINDVKKSPTIISGTGFFIDDKGTVITNRHVVQPSVDVTKVREDMMGLFNSLKQNVYYQMQTLAQQYSQLENEKSDCSYYDVNDGNTYTDQEKLDEINSQQEDLNNQYNDLSNTYNGLNAGIDPAGIKIVLHSEIGIAYNDTYVTTDKDFLERNPCVVTRASEKEDVDLALIQLKNKKTPEGKYVFNINSDVEKSSSFIDKAKYLFSSNDDKENLQINQQLYMIGYNAGLVLANTKQGIKAQLTSGKVTQLPDGQRLLYSIPTLQGSSGSPIIDEYGNVVAVNFAKLGTTDNFNFGIPLARVEDFLNAK